VFGNPPQVFGSTHLRNDKFIGGYGQVNIDLTPRVELTLAGRWDRNRYDSTQYADRSLGEVVPTADGANTQEATDSKFQPKLQLSYRWTDDVMGYLSVARGFRTGFFNSGARTAAETTTNYEIGLKTMLLDSQLSVNTALYHIDYSDQQFTFIIPTPPFRASTNIPKTAVDGLEVEVAARPTQNLSLNAAVGVTDARVADGTDAPNTPKITLNLGASYERPLTPSLTSRSRIDFRRQGSYYLERGNAYSVGPKNFLNVRTSLAWDRWSAGLWVENLLDDRQVGELAIFPMYGIRLSSPPRTYGVEFRYGL
jgi:iron complex outermembrane receptor protein